MKASSQPTPWNPPGTYPQQIGEYRAGLEYWAMSECARRYWNGRNWSNPYMSFWPEDLKEKARAQATSFRPYWQNVAEATPAQDLTTP